MLAGLVTGSRVAYHGSSNTNANAEMQQASKHTDSAQEENAGNEENAKHIFTQLIPQGRTPRPCGCRAANVLLQPILLLGKQPKLQLPPVSQRLGKPEGVNKQANPSVLSQDCPP